MKPPITPPKPYSMNESRVRSPAAQDDFNQQLATRLMELEAKVEEIQTNELLALESRLQTIEEIKHIVSTMELMTAATKAIADRISTSSSRLDTQHAAHEVLAMEIHVMGREKKLLKQRIQGLEARQSVVMRRVQDMMKTPESQ